MRLTVWTKHRGSECEERIVVIHADNQRLWRGGVQRSQNDRQIVGGGRSRIRDAVWAKINGHGEEARQQVVPADIQRDERDVM